jgi:hypothetical protein
MRRPVLYLAGLLLATGASLALAGPATAAPSHDSVKSQGNHWYNDDDECDEDYDDWYYNRHHRHHHHDGGNFNSYNSTSNNGVQILSGNIIDLL